MRKLLQLIFSILLFSFPAFAQNIGLGTTNPHPSAILDINSANKGMLVPRMNTNGRMNITSPAAGLLVYDTDYKSYWYFNGTIWNNISTSSGNGFVLPFDTTLNIQATALRISNSGHAIEASSTNGSGIASNSVNGSGINALSTHGFGIVSTSVNSTALYAFSNNSFPTINASNSSFGVAIKGSSTSENGIHGISGGTSRAGIRGEGNGSSGIGVFGTSTSGSGYGVYGNNSTGVALYGFSSSGTGVKAFSSTGLALDINGKVRIAGGNTSPSDGAVLTSDANGNAVWENNKVAFRVKGVNSGQLGISNLSTRKVEFATEDYDLGNNFALLVGSVWANSSTFTVPKSGIYHFSIAIDLEYLSSGTYDYGDIKLKKTRNGITTSIASQSSQFNNLDFITLTLNTDAQLLSGDIVWVEVLQANTDNAASTLYPGPTTHFSGHLVIAE